MWADHGMTPYGVMPAVRTLNNELITTYYHFDYCILIAEKDNDGSLDRLCRSVSNLAKVENEKLQSWLAHVILGSASLSPSASATNVPPPTVPPAPA